MKFSYQLLKQMAPGIKSKAALIEKLNFHAFEAADLEKDSLEIVVPANRYSDAASHLGAARIASAIFATPSGRASPDGRGGQLKEPAYAKLTKKPSSKNFGVKISAKKHCRRYNGLYVEITKTASSPQWLKDILTVCGLRPINAAVDIMNYVMLETGQPMHAFDADPVSGDIEVRYAEKGEKITTLDKDEFVLNPEDLVIADEKNALAIAGIKGGGKAEINSNSRRIIVESANFDGPSVYKTSRRLNLFTDASGRFAHGLSPALAETGLRRAAQLLQEICGAKIGDWIDAGDYKESKRVLRFHIDKFNSLTGLNLKESVCLDYLKKLGFGGKGAFVEIPAWRPDVSIFEDLVEEIVNLYGYENLPARPPRVGLLPSGYEDQIKLKDQLRNLLVSFGLSEVYNYSFIGGKKESGLAELENPIAEDKKYLRPNLAAGLEKNLEENLRFRDAVRVFEIGKIFRQEKGSLEESLSLGLALGVKPGAAMALGHRAFLELKGMTDQLLQAAGLTEFFFKDETPEKLRIESDHHVLGYLWLAGSHAFAEINLDHLLELAEGEKEYLPLPKYPAITRDISLIVGSDKRAGEIQNLLENESQLIADVDMLDWYEDSKLGLDKRSLTFRLVFQAEDRTLTDEEADKIIKKITADLEEKFDAEIR